MNGKRGSITTSAILIATGKSRICVYRSVNDVPPQLRPALSHSTNGLNSATIVIADRGGREELARAAQGLPAELPSKVAGLFRPKAEDARQESASRMGFRFWLEAGLLSGMGALTYFLFLR
jgi:hypothetical protein